MSDLKSVDEVLARMISNSPTLWASRMDALNRVFTYSSDWSKGYPINDDLAERESDLDKPLDETLTGSDAKYYRNSTLAEKRADRAEALFIRAQAALIAAAESGRFHDFRYTPRFTTYHLNNIPLATLSEDWRKALSDYCSEILIYDEDKVRLRKKLDGVSDEYIEREVQQLRSSKEAAQETLARLGKGEKREAAARAAAIEALRLQAQKFGLKLVPQEG